MSLRFRVAAVAFALALTAAGLMRASGRWRSRIPHPAEPTSLGGAMLSESFGLGLGVTYSHLDAKAFDYFFDGPPKAMVLLHFQSREISEGELLVTANGVTVGSVPADLLDGDHVFHQVVIRPGVLKMGERNRIAFESTRNPPHRDTWRVWNLWAETKALPQLPADELIREASALLGRAEQGFERREIAAANRYSAWRDFRAAWLMLEAVPDSRPDLRSLAQGGMAQAQRELDRVCARLMLQLERSHALGQIASAREALDEVKSYFPGNDQPCPWKADQRRAELNL